MDQAFLIRTAHYSTHTEGVFVIDNNIFYTVERPWLNNERNISCIPTGTYKVGFLPRSASGRYRNVYHLLGVSGRSGILIHNGNLVDHSRGCIILGLRKGKLGNKFAVLNSRTAIRKLNSLTREFELKVM